MDKMKRLGPITDNLNKALNRALQNFSSNTEWTDINNWLLSVETIISDNPSPFINQKIALAKRLSQCTNPILPEKVHECVLKIHEAIFYNMRASVDNNINEYVKLFSEDLGIYSLSILPYFTHTSVTTHRLMILHILNQYYVDLGRELIPMISGIFKAILPVYNQTVQENLQQQIQKLINKLIIKAGRRYTIAGLWSSVLKFTDCRGAGVKMLARFIQKMEFIKGEQDYQSSHGFSQEERQIMEEMNQIETDSFKVNLQQQKKVEHKQQQKQEPVNLQTKSDHIIQQPPKQPKQRRNLKRAQTLTLQNSLLTKIRQQQHEDQSRQVSEKQKKQLQESGNNMTKSQADLGQLFLKGNRNQPKLLASKSETQNAIANNTIQHLHSIKLNKVPLMITPGISLIKEGIDQDSDQNNFPHHSTLVVSALIACLDDDSPLIKRSALDFMFSHLRLKSHILDDNDKKLLIEASLRLFRKKQISITKRVNRWLLGKEDEQNRFTINNKNQFVVPLIIQALVKIFDTEPTDQESCVVPLKIIQNFYMQHYYLVEHTIHEITVDILRYIFNYSDGYQFSEHVLKAGKRFFENIPTYYPIILKSLGNKFLEGVKNDDEHLAFESIKYIDYCYIKMMHHEHEIQQLNYITISLQLVCEGLKIFAIKHQIGNSYYTIYLKDATLLIYNLLARRKSVQKYMEKQKKKLDKKYLDETGNQNLPKQRIEYQNTLKQQEDSMKEVFLEILEKLQYYFIGLGTVIKTSSNIQIYQNIYRLSSKAMVHLQLHLPENTSLYSKQLPKWFMTIQYGIRVSNPSVSLAAIQAMINCLMNQQNHPIFAQLKAKIIHDKNSQKGSDYQNLALQKLWALLDFPHMHNNIIDLIVAYSKFFPNQFTETVKKSFKTHNDSEKEASIQRFSHFWRLTGFKYKGLIISNRQFAELNKVGLFKMLDFLDDQNPLVRHAAKNWMIDSLPLFHRILEPLFHELMDVCGDFYTTPKGLLVIQNKYDTSIIFSTFRRIRSLLSNGSYSFLRFIYQKELHESLEELRGKVTQFTTTILAPHKDTSKAMRMSETHFEKEPVLPRFLQSSTDIKMQDTDKNIEKKMTYIDMLIIVSVKFIQGLALESMGIDFYTGNSGVNTSAIQLLQSLINYIDDPQLCYRLVDYIMQPLSKVLSQSVTNKQYIIQIQLLNIFRTIFFNSSFRKKGELQKIREFFKDSVFTQKYFLTSLLNGLHTPFSYVRSQFINFITSCIPLIADFLDPEKCTECIKNILFTYYKIIKQIKFSLIQEVLEEQDNRLTTINQIQGRNKKERTLGLSRIVEFEIKAKKQEKLINISANLQEMAKTNEVLSILHGVSAILNYFYDFDKMNIADMKFQFSNPYTIFDTFKSLISLGFASSIKTGRLIEKTEFLHNMETCQSILKDMSPVYQTILRAWPLSEQFVRIATEQFTSIGSRVFSFEKFSKYNKVLKDLIIFVKRQKQSIWGKIFSILQPMYYKFPREITEIYLNLWIKDCTNVGGFQPDAKAPINQKLDIKPKIKNTQFLMKIIETIVVSDFPMNIVIHAFLQTDNVEEIRQFYNRKKKQKSLQTLSFYVAQAQTKLLYFLYVYFMYLNIDEKNLNKDSLIEIWSVILKAIKPFLQSRNPSTSMWILDIINMCSIKYSPKQILVNQKFKSDLHGIVNQTLKYVAAIAAKKQPVFYEDPTNTSFDDDKTSSQKFRIILPIPPSLFQIFKKKTKQKNEMDKLLFEPVRPGDLSELQLINRLWSFKMLKKIGFEILQNVYLSQKMHFGVIRACQWIQIILPVIEDKSKENMIFAESASEVLHNLLQTARVIFIKPLRQSTLRIFNKDDFFICNKKTLIYWAQIMDWIVSVDRSNETFSEYLNKVSLSSSYFTSQNQQNKRRIKSFQRICFILYSGQRDKYANKIKGLLEKIADVIKIAESAHPALLILVLFSIRILILKLSEISLNQLFIDIWPMILAFLMQIFSKKLVKVEVANQISRNPNLLLAALKLIEMISVANLGQFAHHQWIFIYDYFGVRLSLLDNSQEMSQILSSRPQLTSMVEYSHNQNSSPFYFKPYIFNYMPHYSIQYIPEKINRNSIQNKNEKHFPFKQIGYQPQHRQIVVKDSFVRSEDEVKCYVLLMAQYLVKTNEYRMAADPNEIEEVIINDFIMLDNFIHKI